MKIRFLLILALVPLFIIGCENQHKQKEVTTRKYAPVVNPKPKYFLAVKGKIDPCLQQKIKLKWVATYYTNNDKCEIITNHIEGVTAPREKNYLYKIKPDAQGNFELKIPLNKLNAGYCNWRLFWIGYNLNNLKNVTVLYASKKTKPLKVTAQEKIICKKNGECTSISTTNYGDFSDAINPNQNYTYILNIGVTK